MRVFAQKFNAKIFSITIFRMYVKISVLRKEMYITLAPGLRFRNFASRKLFYQVVVNIFKCGH